MKTAQIRIVNSKKEISSLSVKVSVITTTLRHGGTTSSVNEGRVSENSTNNNRAVQLWWELGKIANPRKEYNKKRKGIQ